MRKATDYIETTYTMFSEATRRDLMFRTAEDATFDGRIVTLDGRPLVTFGAGSYLGLEHDPRLKQGAIEATLRYGTQFPSSRAYVSAPLYQELETLLEEILGAPVLVSQSTAVGHQSALPILISDEDVVVLDQQVHFSVHQAMNQVRLQGTPVEIIRHNRMDELESSLERLRRKHRHIWYMADGVYSMFGDFAPYDDLKVLLDRYPQLYLYLDDAHGMSWTGPRGRGVALSRLPHERVVVAVSLNKSFSAAGGAIVVRDAMMRRKITLNTGSMIYSGPIQPPMLGAAVASAKIHLGPDLDELQAKLRERLALCNRLMLDRGLPLVSPTEAPIRFLGLGLPRVAFRMASRLMEEGFFANVATFPLIPMKKAGVRFNLSVNQTLDDIRGFVDAAARHLPAVLAEEQSSLEDVRRVFGLASADDRPTTKVERPRPPGPPLEHVTTIHDVPAHEWDGLLGDLGSFTTGGLALLEETFREQSREENNWRFHYFTARRPDGAPLLMTFFTEALWKVDMLAKPEVSRRIERVRATDPMYLTSRVLMMGSSITEGQHLFVDRSRPWKDAVRGLLDAVGRLQERCGAKFVVLRDFPSDDLEMDALMLDCGFTKHAMPESFVLDIDWTTDEGFLARLSRNGKRHQRNAVLAWEPAYEVEVFRKGASLPDAATLAHFYALYRQVKARAFEINTFDLPENLFERMLAHPEWELYALRLRPDHGGERGGLPVGVVAAFRGRSHYAPIVAGLDYRYVPSHGLYRQALLQAVRRAQHHGLRRVYLGMAAPLEKSRFGAKRIAGCAYVQAAEHYDLEVLASVMADTATS
ncbi:MAG: bifunctional aminotransferase class I/II-fold pyridoxal phosphate-dependent enzyme/GNAT family N-acetyltransferase [Nannocystaceae bacterium]